MKAPHWWQVEEGPEAFAELFAAAAALGLRLGWLELDLVVEPPPPLAAAAAAGAFRAVAVSSPVGGGAGQNMAVKPRRGPSVPDDLLREYFLGCAAVLVRGASPRATARLTPGPAGFRLRGSEEGAPEIGPLSAAELAARLRRPRPEAP